MDNDVLLASAVRFLIDGREEAAASALLACQLDADEWDTGWYSGNHLSVNVDIELRGPRAAFDLLGDEANPMRQVVRSALEALLPPYHSLSSFDVRAELIDIDPDWRVELLDMARGRGVHNQAKGAECARVWRNLLFRSQSEVRVAEALDRVGVLFLPNCRARLGGLQRRENREADFLVCHHGKWGILEVDGEPFHPPSRTVHDHERDRLFKQHGIRVVEHYDADRCYSEADHVVDEFLALLAAR